MSRLPVSIVIVSLVWTSTPRRVLRRRATTTTTRGQSPVVVEGRRRRDRRTSAVIYKNHQERRRPGKKPSAAVTRESSRAAHTRGVAVAKKTFRHTRHDGFNRNRLRPSFVLDAGRGRVGSNYDRVRRQERNVTGGGWKSLAYSKHWL